MSDIPQLLTRFIREQLYPGQEVIGLHEPTFEGNEKEYVLNAIESTFVSSVGEYVDRFEEMVAEYTGAAKAVATVNGTAALHAALHVVGVGPNDLVITQPLTFVATANAIRYCGADPVFLDVENDTMGLSPTAVLDFLKNECRFDERLGAIHVASGRRVTACVPMHTFGFPMRIEELVGACDRWKIPVVEDAAESLGSYVHGMHTGRFGRLGTLSFNGNKTITTGGGGMIITDDLELGNHIKHLTTTAKVPHRWEYVHDEVGFNYRLPNLNAALGCAQMEQLDTKLRSKRTIAQRYREAMSGLADIDDSYELVDVRPHTEANYWLNAIRCNSRETRDNLLRSLNNEGIMARPAWELMYRLPAFRDANRGRCPVAEQLADEIVNIPSWPVKEIDMKSMTRG